MEPPGLVQLEREVDLQIERYNCSLDQMTSDLLFINDHDDENPKPNEPLTDPFDDGGAGDECQSAAKPLIEDEASRDEADNINNPVAHMNRSVLYATLLTRSSIILLLAYTIGSLVIEIKSNINLLLAETVQFLL